MTKEQFWYEFPRNVDNWKDGEVVVIDGRYETHLSMIPFDMNPNAMGILFQVKLPDYAIMHFISPYCLNKENPDNVMMQLWAMSNDIFDVIRQYKTQIDSGIAAKPGHYKTLDNYLRSDDFTNMLDQKKSAFNWIYESSMKSADEAFEAFEAQQ